MTDLLFDYSFKNKKSLSVKIDGSSFTGSEGDIMFSWIRIPNL